MTYATLNFTISTKLRLLVIQAMCLTVLLAGCKKEDGPTTPPSAVGNWKITALTFSPAWAAPTGTVPDFVPFLKANSETCLTDVTLTFGTDGTARTNASALASCNEAINSKAFLDFLFEDEASFTETETELILYGKGKLTALPLVKSGAGNVLNIQFVDATDFSNKPIRTTYTLRLEKQ
ncbi:hypothetical protein [Fibrella aquatica]|uniref:hypothetical protein n=1 Tax=Fibrella aquatica TaxID=3242487 RepID=UPI003522DB45